MSFTDTDLKHMKEDINCFLEIEPDSTFVALLARLEAAELALEDADCDCRGNNKPEDLVHVCRFFKRLVTWKQSKGA